jgi:hypothetical protein
MAMKFKSNFAVSVGFAAAASKFGDAIRALGRGLSVESTIVNHLG